MEAVRLHDSGSAVEDIQQRLVRLGFLSERQVDGEYGEETVAAVRAFCVSVGIPASDDVTDKVWSMLVDATFCLGDRTLYLRMPYFHGSDVLELQQALAALGFSCGNDDGIFGAHTENALRRFQENMGLPSDGIAGAYTFAAIQRLHHSWAGKDGVPVVGSTGFARVSDVLESHAVCLFGTDAFTRSVASRMSNLALATNPASSVVSAESMLVAPGDDTLLVRIALPETLEGEAAESASESVARAPQVSFANEETLSLRLHAAISAALTSGLRRVTLVLPGTVWMDAGEGRSAQHFAITLLDALCAALA